MSRETKFRAWDSVEKRIVSPEELLERDVYINPTDGMLCVLDEEKEMICTHLERLDFTGLHDKNGKEIWEGDIIWISETTRAVIKYFGAGFEAESLTEKYGDSYKTYGWSSFKRSLVLGNIHEHPDLLK